ncbi:helix-turn-helix domain-containing protein [Aestuariivirga sp. YIM B02566]|uniref:Helix-turn-helix transcriptional regulator n=1 Tax=Taklimakanibacter albus TaxID=2800327 RepID=A0ACC5R6J8_9HYPH|nr:helix-turn-helix transcriptional regulator [Aestuariivirga sp. YIM B02566]MBK1868291.1 helix-turn-helix transcriptional regulator [Aestuariivirga sp. YIM B02566]
MIDKKKRKKGDVGQRLRQARGNASLVAFAAQVGSNKTSWSLYESEERSPDLDLLIRVREVTGISLDWLADGDERTAAPAPIDAEILAGIVRAIEDETPKLDTDSKARLIAGFYNRHLKLTASPIPAASAKKVG